MCDEITDLNVRYANFFFVLMKKNGNCLVFHEYIIITDIYMYAWIFDLFYLN